MTEASDRTAPRTHAAPTTRADANRWIAPAALVVAVVAAGLAVWALSTSPSPSTTPNAEPAVQENQSSGDPKLRVCSAFDTVSRAVSLQTNADLGPDPLPQAAVAANARLSLVGGGEYLLSRLDAATTPELAGAVRAFAQDLQDIGMNALAGQPYSDPTQADRLTRADSTRKTIAAMCT